MSDRDSVESSELKNVGRKTRLIVLPAKHPNTDAIARESAIARGETGARPFAELVSDFERALAKLAKGPA